MQPERWQKVKETLLLVLEKPENERARLLAEIGGDDEELRKQVEELLAVETESEDFIEKPVASLSEVFPEDGAAGAEKKFGNYRIVREIGRGGMGAVFLAERIDGAFEQQVALKIVRQTLADAELERRFKQERQILASLNHPNIARLLDGGVSQTGEPFLAMEHIEGKPLLEFADERNLNLEERLRLFLKICRPVAFAHRNLIVHRDIKPSNILVDESGEPKLLDFGLAKLSVPSELQTTDYKLQTDPKSEFPNPKSEVTAFRAFTPAYASPEQLRGARASTASDIYSLGIVLYELLTGEKPFHFENKSLEEILRTITTEAPPPSSISNSKFQISNKNPKSKIPNPKSLKGDLDHIVLTALRKEPERRYRSVEALAEDIELFLESKPIKARPATFRYLASKFVRRNKIAVTAGALVLLAIVSGLIIALWQAGIARQERDQARRERYKAERISEFLSSALTYSDPAAAVPGSKNRRDATINQLLDDYAPRIETELADQPDIRASLLRTVGLAYLSQWRLAEAERYLNAALETHLKLYGENHPETAATYAGLASVMEAKTDFPKAVELLQKTISIYRRQPPTEAAAIRNFANALNMLGDVSWTKGDYDAADAAFTESLELASRTENSGGELIADAKRGLGMIRYAQGRLDEATSLVREAIAEYRSLPHLRWKLPDALNILGQTLMWRSIDTGSGEYDEALKYLRESETIGLEIWGENNFWYPRSLWLQAFTLCFKGEYAAAEKALNRAEEVNDRYFAGNKGTKANLLAARALLLTRTNRAAAGETLARQAIEYYLSVMNPGTASVTLARMHLAESLTAQKKYEEAEKILGEAYKDASEANGTEHWRTKEVEKQLTELRKNSSKF